jgi:hypothetical protein
MSCALAGWAAEVGTPISLGNTFLEVGVPMATALLEVEWQEYSFHNFDHLVENRIEIRDGYAYTPDRPGHGLMLSEEARHEWARHKRLDRSQLGQARRTIVFDYAGPALIKPGARQRWAYLEHN